ncbi:glutaredoxin [Candidatus Woesearchaeota archaeon]|nr:glutaredoxin [Nanoarchaeota archaeon]MCB9370679.1 glutaredoxin [Candidatus Woesearchaeota archaeon]USN43763.1 MAG: glutaredoxin [Candidatus Woesearchaeota archaeon]
MTHIQIYTIKGCPYCEAAKEFFDREGLSYEEIPSDKNKEEIKQKTGHPTFPQIFIEDDFIGGYDDLMHLNETGQLNEMLGRSEEDDMLDDDADDD